MSADAESRRILAEFQTTRRDLKLLLARADGQTWESLGDAPSDGEFMYGAMADHLIAAGYRRQPAEPISPDVPEEQAWEVVADVLERHYVSECAEDRERAEMVAIEIVRVVGALLGGDDR